MKRMHFVLAWMLVGISIFEATSAAEDASTLPSVMVNSSAKNTSPPVVPAPVSAPAPAASEAPAWQPSASPPPQALPDTGDAKPLSPQADIPTPTANAPLAPPAVVAPALNTTPALNDGKLDLPNPPDLAVEPAPVEQIRYEETLPPPTNNPAGSTWGGSQNGFNSGTPTRTPTNSVIAPPTNSSPTIDAATQAAARAAADLLSGSLSATSDDARWVSLSQVLSRCQESERVVVTQAYWRLSRACSEHRWALDEQKRLEQIVANRNSIESPMLATARGSAAARVTESEIEVTNAWSALARTISSWDSAGNYRPADKPLVGPYHTYYNQIFASRPNANAWQIDRAMPLRLKAINDRASTVHSATSAIYYAEQAHAKGEADLQTVLACHDDLRIQRRNFLEAVLQYNLDVAEYAAAAAPAGTSSEKFASMLIPAKPPERVSAVPTRPSLPSSTAGQRPLPGSDGWVPSSIRGSSNSDPFDNRSRGLRYGNSGQW